VAARVIQAADAAMAEDPPFDADEATGADPEGYVSDTERGEEGKA
jgi:hypothetical protein